MSQYRQRDHSLRDLLTSSELLTFLYALPGPLTKVGPAHVGGVPVTEYSSSVSLAAIYALAETRASDVFAGPPTPLVPGATLVPPANTITIAVRLWLDAHGRLRQLQATEPLFTGFYQDNGFEMERAVQLESMGLASGACLSSVPNAPHCPITNHNLGKWYQQSFALVTVRLSNFGPTRIRTPSPSRTVTSPSN
jgi:hypothetical protein